MERYKQMALRFLDRHRELILKLVVSLIIAQTTEFVPDEGWQSTEVAHFIHFRRGHLTWEWKEGIRSFIVPLIITLMYKVGAVFGLDNYPFYLIGAPQILQAGFTLFGLICFKKVANARVGLNAGRIASALMEINWFTTFCGARMITNQIELSLNCICLWLLQDNRFSALTVLLGVNFMIRPTVAIFWIPFVPELLVKFWDLHLLHKIFSVLMGLITLIYGWMIDMSMYKQPVISWWEFFMFNFVNKGSADFGVHPALWYFYSALPSVIGPLIIFLPFGIFFRGQTRKLFIYLAFYLFVYSWIDHKEIRFLLPALPLIFMVLGSVLNAVDNQLDLWRRQRKYRKLRQQKTTCYWTFIFLNVAATAFFGVYHQYGIKPATQLINRYIDELKIEIPAIWLLMPCYSVPVYTYLHHPTAQYEHYICAPERFLHHYANLSVKSKTLLQPNCFERVNLREDIIQKVSTEGPPDFIMAYDPAVPIIMSTFMNMNLTYSECGAFPHTMIGSFARSVHVLCAEKYSSVSLSNPWFL